MYSIYLIINEGGNKTYIGFTDDIKRRISEHGNRKVKTTKNFGNFKHLVLEDAETSKEARTKEKYWKSCTGRKKLKKLFKNLLSS